MADSGELRLLDTNALLVCLLLGGYVVISMN